MSVFFKGLTSSARRSGGMFIQPCRSVFPLLFSSSRFSSFSPLTSSFSSLTSPLCLSSSAASPSSSSSPFSTATPSTNQQQTTKKATTATAAAGKPLSAYDRSDGRSSKSTAFAVNFVVITEVFAYTGFFAGVIYFIYIVVSDKWEDMRISAGVNFERMKKGQGIVTVGESELDGHRKQVDDEKKEREAEEKLRKEENTEKGKKDDVVEMAN